jgi:hypothetical protein
MWAFYGKEARKIARNPDYLIDEAHKHVNGKFGDADVSMMCQKFLNVKKQDILASRHKMNDVVLDAYAKGPKAHSNKQTEHTHKQCNINTQTYAIS